MSYTVLTLAFLALVSFTGAQDAPVSPMTFHCNNRPADGKTEIAGHPVQISFPQERFEHDKGFAVVLKANEPEMTIWHLGIQALDLAGNPVGSWNLPEDWTRKPCRGGEMIYSPMPINQHELHLMWTAPAFDETNLLRWVEFNFTVMMNEGEYRMMKTQLIEYQEDSYNPHEDPSEFEEPPAVGDDEEEGEVVVQEDPDGETGNPGENPNGGEELYAEMAHHAEELDNAGGETPTEEPQVDLHNGRAESEHYQEMLAQQQAAIDLENRNSEGEWTRQQELEREREQAEYDWEMQEYERVQYEEQRRREEIMLAEIRDKEEHDAMLARQSTTPVSAEEEEEISNDTELSQEEEIVEEEIELPSSEDEAYQVGDGVAKATSGFLVVASILFYFLA